MCFCQGNMTLVTDDVPAAIRHFGDEGRIAFGHFRDVRGVPESFEETFHDEGQTDMRACMDAWHQIGFDGVLRPDHVPTLNGEADGLPVLRAARPPARDRLHAGPARGQRAPRRGRRPGGGGQPGRSAHAQGATDRRRPRPAAAAGGGAAAGRSQPASGETGWSPAAALAAAGGRRGGCHTRRSGSRWRWGRSPRWWRRPRRSIQRRGLLANLIPVRGAYRIESVSRAGRRFANPARRQRLARVAASGRP